LTTPGIPAYVRDTRWVEQTAERGDGKGGGVLDDTVVRGATVLLAGLFAAAIAHKIQMLATRSAASEPLIRVSAWRKAHATPVIVSALIVEAVVAVLILFDPAAGLAAASLLVAVYAFEMRRLPRDEGCRCFGSLTRSNSRAAAIRRNLVLLVLCALGWIGYEIGAVHDADVTPAAVGVASVGAALLLAPVAVNAFGLPTQPRIANPEEG
jgi:hypothetical protein